MADYVDQWSVAGRKNILVNVLMLLKCNQEAGLRVSFLAVSAGALTTTYTASQSLTYDSKYVQDSW